MRMATESRFCHISGDPEIELMIHRPLKRTAEDFSIVCPFFLFFFIGDENNKVDFRSGQISMEEEYRQQLVAGD